MVRKGLVAPSAIVHLSPHGTFGALVFVTRGGTAAPT